MMKSYLVILSLFGGGEIIEPATYDECQAVFRQLRFHDASGRTISATNKVTGRTGRVVGFECRPAEHKDGVPSS